MAPSSLDRTWSLHSIATDANRLNKMLSDISTKWNIDTKAYFTYRHFRWGTYSMLLSIAHQSPFTHYAPIAAAVHVLINQHGNNHCSCKKTFHLPGPWWKGLMFPVVVQD